MIGQMLPQNMLTATFADGTTGFFDPADGTYYDSQGNDVTGYVQNFGGARLGAPATPEQIAAAEGITLPTVRKPVRPTLPQLPPGPAPRVASTPSALPSAPGLFEGTTFGIPNVALLGIGGIVLVAVVAGGGRRR